MFVQIVYNLLRDAELENLLLVHTREHISSVQAYSSNGKDDVCKLQERWKTYTCDETFACALRSTGCCLALVDAVLDGKVYHRDI